jgi:putative peptidoglycan lipid II flippase
MRPVLMVFALGLPFLSFVNIVLRAFYAQKDTATPVRAAALSFVVNLGLSLVLMVPWGTIGLAVASNVAIVVQAVYLQTRLARKRNSLAFHHVVRDLAKVVVAAGVMGAVVAAGWWAWFCYAHAGKLADALGLLVLIGVGVLVYAALVWWMRIEGRDDLAAVLGKVRAKFG